MTTDHSTDPTEIWKLIPDWPEYEASTEGRIRRATRSVWVKAGFILKPMRIWNGYDRVALYRKCKRHMFLVHRLVAAAFIGPCPSGKVVDHIDGIRHHNALKNLRYVTPEENHAPGKLTQANKDDMRKALQQGATSREMSTRFGVSTTYVCVLKKRWAQIV